MSLTSFSSLSSSGINILRRAVSSVNDTASSVNDVLWAVNPFRRTAEAVQSVSKKGFFQSLTDGIENTKNLASVHPEMADFRNSSLEKNAIFNFMKITHFAA